MLGQIGLPGGGFGLGYGSMADVGDAAVAARLADLSAGQQPGRRLHPGRAHRRHAAAIPGEPFDYDGKR